MKYIDSSHSYINDSGESYMSVTKLIKMFQPKKDWDEIARKYAEKHKRSYEEVKAEWNEEGRKSIEKGTAYHDKMEKLYIEVGQWEIEGNMYPVRHMPIIDDIKLAIPLKLEESIYPELIIYSHKFKVAGQADLVEVVKGSINIKDYKTSKKIDTKSYKDWKGSYEMMLHPVQNLMNCKFNEYALQINLYMNLLKAHNPKLKIGVMEIQHIKDSEDPFSDEPKIEIIKVPNLQKEARSILEYYLKQISAN